MSVGRKPDSNKIGDGSLTFHDMGSMRYQYAIIFSKPIMCMLFLISNIICCNSVSAKKNFSNESAHSCEPAQPTKMKSSIMRETYLTPHLFCNAQMNSFRKHSRRPEQSCTHLGVSPAKQITFPSKPELLII